MSLQKINVSIPVTNGLDTKTDSKQVMAGNALVLENARFQKTGKLSKRFGLIPKTVSTSSGPDLDDTTPFAVVPVKNSLSTITNSGTYSYFSGQDKWVKVSEFSKSVTSNIKTIQKTGGDHLAPDYDRDPVSGLEVFSSSRYSAVSEFDRGASISVRDESTNSVITKHIQFFTLNPTFIQTRVSIINDSGVVRIILAYSFSTGVTVISYDQFLNEISTNSLIPGLGTGNNWAIDIVKDGSYFYVGCARSTTLSFFKLNPNGTTASTATIVLANALLQDGLFPCGFCLCIDSSIIHMAYCADGITDGRFIAIGYDKTFTQAITPLITTDRTDKIGLVSDGTNLYASSSYSVYTDQSSSFHNFYKLNISTSYTMDPLSFEFRRLSVISKPFINGGHVYAICINTETLNKSAYILEFNKRKIDAHFLTASIPVDPTVVVITPPVPTHYSCSSSVYSDSFLRTAVSREFDTSTYNYVENEFQATIECSSVTLGFDEMSYSRQTVENSSYIASGLLVEASGSNIHENNFLFTPMITSIQVGTVGTANPAVASKTFSYVVMYEFFDTNGTLTMSTPSLPKSVTTGANAVKLIVEFVMPPGTYKFRDEFSMRAVLFRTETLGSVHYRVKTSPMRLNDGSLNGFEDTLSDADLINNERLYTTGGVLPNDPAPLCRFSTSGGNRLFLGGLENRDEIAYSKKQLAGESVNFNGNFRIRISTAQNADSSDMSGLGYLDGKIIIFREQSIYYISGDGPLETGLQDSFTEPEGIATDVGCVDPRSVLSTPAGIMFKSRKGIYLLDRALQVSYRGKEVEDFNSERIKASILSDKYNEARFYTDAGNCLVFNYLFETWSVFKNQTMVDADTWQGSPVSILNNSVLQETEDTFEDNSLPYSMRFTSPWLKISDVQGYQRCYQIWIIGEFKSLHTLKCKIFTDYNDSVSEDYDLIYDGTDGNQYQFSVSIPNQKVESIKFEIYDTDQSGTCESFSLSNLQAEIGIKAGGYKLAATKSY